MPVSNNFLLKIGADNADFISKLKASETSVKRLGDSASGLKTAFTAAFSALTTALAVNKLKDLAENIDSVGKFADRLGLPTEYLISMQRAAELAGTSTEALRKGFIKLAVNTVDAAKGAEEMQANFSALGLNAKQLANIPLEQRFGIVADALNKVQDSATRTALAYKIFGKAGAELLTVISLGSSGFKQAEEEAKKLGITLNRLDIEQVEKANDAMADVGLAIQGVEQKLIVLLAPAIELVSKLLSDSIPGAADKGAKSIFKLVDNNTLLIDSFGYAAKTAGIFFDTVSTGFSLLASGALIAKDHIISIFSSESLEELYKKDDANFKSFSDKFSNLKKDLKDFLEGEAPSSKLKKALEDAGKEQDKLKNKINAGAKNGLLDTDSVLGSLDTSKNNQKIEDPLKKLRAQAENLLTPFEKLKKQQAEYKQLLDATLISQDAFNLYMQEAQKAYDDTTEAGKRHNKALEFTKEALEKAKTPTEQLTEQLGYLEEAFNSVGLTEEQKKHYAEAIYYVKSENAKLSDSLAKTNDSMQAFADQAARNIQSSFADFLFDPFKDGLKGMLLDFVNVLRRMVAEALASKILGSLLSSGTGGVKGGTGAAGGSGVLSSILGSLVGSANGNVFNGGSITPFANGGVVSAPTIFPMKTGLGLMGEAGAEAVMPLARDSSGKLGVKSSGESQNIRIVNVLDPGVFESFITSQRGEKLIINTLNNNPSVIRRLAV